MVSNCESAVRADWSLKIPFDSIEAARFRAFLLATGRKAGPWVRTLAIRAMDEAEGRGDGSIQAREMAEILRGEK